MPVRDGEIQQTSRVETVAKVVGYIGDELVNPFDRLQHRFPEHRVAESAVILAGAGIITSLLHAVEKQGERPFAVGAPLDSVEPFGFNGQG